MVSHRVHREHRAKGNRTESFFENFCVNANVFRKHYLSLSVPSVNSSESAAADERVRATPNSGIALIMVLGLLTVMVLMAVTFAVSMRTERLAAGNAADNVRARELVQVGLARAMDDIKALICMPSCFSIDDANKIVLVRPNHDFHAGDEVRVFSPSNLPGGPVGGGLVTGFVYKVSDIDQEEYIIELVSNNIPLIISDDGKFNDRVIISDHMPGPEADDLSGMRSYACGTPIRLSGDPQTKYVIPVDELNMKWAISYSKALKGEVDPSMMYSPELELQPIHGIYPVVTNKWAEGNKLIYYADRERLRTGMAVRLESPDPSDPLPLPLSAEKVYYVRCVSNQVNTNATPVETNLFIQLCDSYTNAVANRPIAISYPLPPDDKFVIIPVPSVISSNPALVSYSTNQMFSLSDFSELVTMDTALDTVHVTNNYCSGEAVTFTTTGTLPTPLNERIPYYVVTVSRGVIRLAASIDDASSVPPVTLDLVSGAGTHRMYKLGLSGEATNYIPMSVYTKTAEALAAASSNLFVGIYASTNGELMGKVRYVIADCSGLLDANFIGSSGSRYWGNNPGEFNLANLPESPSSLPGNRTTYKRYETLYELAQNLGYHPENLFVYSYSQPEQWDPYLMNLNMPVNITGDVVLLEDTLKMSAITNALWLAGFTNVDEAGIVYSNLLDYVDDDLLPRNLDYCVENVPMINEVAAGCSVDVTDNGDGTKHYKVWYTNRCECFYPFALSTNQNFTLDAAITFNEPTSGNQIKPSDYSYSSNTVVSAAGDYIAINNHTSREFDGPPLVPPQLVSLVSTFSLSVKSDGVAVDQLNVSLVITNKMNCPADSLYNFTWTAAECLDPRFNFDPANPNQWSKEEGLATEGKSMGNVNNWTAAHLYGSQLNPAMPTNDYDTAIFVANRSLVSAGELGYLVYSTNAPWKTVKLYGPDRHRVLDVFAIAKDANDWFAHTISRGQINPNTKSLDVMKAWFQGMPVDKYPGQLAAPTLGESDAETVAQLIVDHAGSYTNLSDIGRVLTAFPSPALPSELEKESYFRNTCGLFNIHQNVFTILIEAKAASGGNIPKNPARQRAVAIVWRDPFTGEMFIRHIKWLGD